MNEIERLRDRLADYAFKKITKAIDKPEWKTISWVGNDGTVLLAEGGSARVLSGFQPKQGDRVLIHRGWVLKFKWQDMFQRRSLSGKVGKVTGFFIPYHVFTTWEDPGTGVEGYFVFTIEADGPNKTLTFNKNFFLSQIEYDSRFSHLGMVNSGIDDGSATPKHVVGMSWAYCNPWPILPSQPKYPQTIGYSSFGMTSWAYQWWPYYGGYTVEGYYLMGIPFSFYNATDYQTYSNDYDYSGYYLGDAPYDLDPGFKITIDGIEYSRWTMDRRSAFMEGADKYSHIGWYMKNSTHQVGIMYKKNNIWQPMITPPELHDSISVTTHNGVQAAPATEAGSVYAVVGRNDVIASHYEKAITQDHQSDIWRATWVTPTSGYSGINCSEGEHVVVGTGVDTDMTNVTTILEGKFGTIVTVNFTTTLIRAWEARGCWGNAVFEVTIVYSHDGTTINRIPAIVTYDHNLEGTIEAYFVNISNSTDILRVDIDGNLLEESYIRSVDRSIIIKGAIEYTYTLPTLSRNSLSGAYTSGDYVVFNPTIQIIDGEVIYTFVKADLSLSGVAPASNAINMSTYFQRFVIGIIDKDGLRTEWEINPDTDTSFTANYEEPIRKALKWGGPVGRHYEHITAQGG